MLLPKSSADLPAHSWQRLWPADASQSSRKRLIPNQFSNGGQDRVQARQYPAYGRIVSNN